MGLGGNMQKLERRKGPWGEALKHLPRQVFANTTTSALPPHTPCTFTHPHTFFSALLPGVFATLAAQGTWFCSLAATCVWSVAGQDTRYGAMHMLRILRVFRIIWILKHFKFMNFRTLLGSLAVRGGGRWFGGCTA